LERSNNTITLLDILNLRPNLVYNSHPFMPKDVAAFELHDLFVVEVQIAAADGGAGYSADDICRLCDCWDGSFDDANI
jgi:hypothetical protein